MLAATARTLVQVTARLASDPGKSTRDVKARRDAIMCELERQNTSDGIATMEKLDLAAARLSWISVALALVGVLLAAVQLIK